MYLARGPLDPRVAGETDDLAEVGDAADAAAELALTDPMDAIIASLKGHCPLVISHHHWTCQTPLDLHMCTTAQG